MNEINSFTFYRNYFEIIRYLPNEDRLKMYDVITKYMFCNEEPELKDLLKGIWINIKIPLDTNIKNITNGKRGGRPKNENPNNNPSNNPNETQTITQTEPKAKANNISTFLFLLSNFKFTKDRGLLRGKIEEWLKYKWERKEYYKETGFKSLLARIDSATSQYGVDEVINLIDECMANNYKGIIFEKLEKKKEKKSKTSTMDETLKEIYNGTIRI